MSSSSKVTEMDSRLSDFQKNLHSNDGRGVISPFIERNMKSCYFETTDSKLPSFVDKEEIGYSIQTTPYHELLYTYLHQITPKITAIDGYQIKLCEHTLFAILEKVRLVFDEDKDFGEWSGLYFFTQWQFMEPNDREVVSKQIGNTPEIQTWSKSIPQWSLDYTLPLFYSERKAKSFPLMLCGKSNKLHLIFKFRNELGEILKIRKVEYFEDSDGLNTEKYTEVPFDYRLIRIGENPNVPATYYLEPPEVWAKYCTHLDVENHLKIHEENKFEFFFDKTEIRECRDNHPLGKTPWIEMPVLNRPVHTLVWMAQNIDSENLNSYFNFTTSPTEESGYSPIGHTTLEVNGVKIMNKIPAWNTENVQPRLIYGNYPDIKGINLYSTNLVRNEGLNPPGRYLDRGSFSVVLQSHNPEISDEEKRQNFKLICVIIYTSKFIFESIPPQADREKSESSILISAQSE